MIVVRPIRSPLEVKRMVIAAAIALACAGAISVSAWTQAPNWRNSDSLYYQAMSLEVGGQSAQAARAHVFDSPLARPAIAQEPIAADPRRISFEAPFFRRRWVVPALAAAIRPVAGERALPDVAIVGYLLFAALLAALLASRFAMAPSVAVAVLIVDLGAVRNWGMRPLTDSWGLVFSVAAVFAALLLLRRGRAWLPVWIALMAALSFTRDLAIAPLAAVAWLMFRDPERETRRSALTLIATGILATIPAYLLFGATLRLVLASVLAGLKVPSASHATWSYIATHYVPFAFGNVKLDIKYAVAHPAVGLSLVAGLGALFALPSRRDPLILLMRGWALGWPIIFLLDPFYSGFRYEIVILPAAAAGLCLLVEHLLVRLERQPALRSADPPRRFWPLRSRSPA